MHKISFLVGRLKQPRTTFAEMSSIVKFARRAARLYGVSYVWLLRRGMRLVFREGFLPHVAFRLGLFDPQVSADDLRKYASKQRAKQLQATVNPRSWSHFTEDKGIFYRYCMAVGIPIPAVYAICFKHSSGWSHNGRPLKSKADWKTFFETEPLSEFVIKPSRGAEGQGVRVLRRANGLFIDALGKSYSSSELHELMLSDSKYDSFVVQERVRNHPDIQRLSNTDFLQTIRIITFVDAAGDGHILHAYLRVLSGGNVIDNQTGQAGNVRVPVEQHDGFLRSAVTVHPDGLGIHSVPNHPDTGVCFAECQIPMWNHVKHVVTETALKMLPVRTIGWDVVVTADDVLILEGNMWWDPPNYHRVLDKLAAAILSDQPLEKIGSGTQDTIAGLGCNSESADGGVAIARESV